MSDLAAAPADARAAPPPRGWLGAEGVPLLYLNMPKSGCTTIKNILLRLQTGSYLAEPVTIHKRRGLFTHWRSDPDRVTARMATDVTFTFVRHPLTRAYSCFNEKFHAVHEYSFHWWRPLLVSDYGAVFEDRPSAALHRDNFKRFLRFAMDTHTGARTDVRKDPHWSPQMQVVRQAERSRKLDFIGRLERFEAQMPAALALAGVDWTFDAPRMNEGPPAPHRLDEVVDAEVRDMAAELYAEDFRAFGYTL